MWPLWLGSFLFPSRGSGETSRDTQTQQDATTVESAAADFFSAQVGADTLRLENGNRSWSRQSRTDTGSRWPEAYISIAYAAVFPEDNLTTVASILFLDKDGTLSDLRPRGLLQGFNAIDFNALVGGEFMEAPPDNANRTSKGFSDYLWLFEKDDCRRWQQRGCLQEGRRSQIGIR